MHTRRLSMLILGVWIGLTIAMSVVAIQNFRGVDRLLEGPAPQTYLLMLRIGSEGARIFLRYQISELNRFFFDWYGTAQVVLALSLGLSLLFATNGKKVIMSLSLALLIIVVLQKVYLTPEITLLGRQLDFVPPSVPLPARSRFWAFHTAFSVSEVLKVALFLVTGSLILKKSESRRRRRHRSTEPEAAGVESD
ncbi:MAG: hypothetical protein HY235_06815 [Acidobacteria bacterium]|nr:hypothetical protein [Acidobacteriota bacterium]